MIFAFHSCEGEDEVDCPEMRTELACAYTGSDGNVYRIVLDDGTKYDISTQKITYLSNATFRCKVVFSDEIDEIKLYSIKPVYIGVIYESSMFSIKPMEHLKFISAWRAGGFLNLNVGIMTSEKNPAHEFAFGLDSIHYNNNVKYACLSLLHVSPESDREAYTYDTFISISLAAFDDCDSIRLSINTCDGLITLDR